MAYHSNERDGASGTFSARARHEGFLATMTYLATSPQRQLLNSTSHEARRSNNVDLLHRQDRLELATGMTQLLSG